MKNSPKTKYLLIALVIIVWGTVIYKVIAGLSANDPVISEQPQTFPGRDTDSIDNNTVISASYPDPFLSDIDSGFTDEEYESSPVQPAKTVAPDASAVAGPASPQEPAPVIKYVGNILNPGTHKSTAIILVNNKSLVVSAHDMIDPNTRIINIQETQITIKQMGKEIILPLAN